jgi:hypothetical protein
VTGAGGAGKTRLSLQAAAELLDGSGDGVWLVELAAISDENAVAPAICEVLGIAAQPGRPVLETLLDALGPQDLLILPDNCEHLIDACAKIADAILRGCPRVHLMATSREPLSIDGETSYRVPPLSLPVPATAALRRRDPRMRSRCSSSGRESGAWTCPSTTRPPRSWCRYANSWTGCRWPSSSPRPGCARCRSVTCTTVSTALPPPHRRKPGRPGYRRESLGRVRAALGEEQFGLVYARAMTLGLDQALDLALGRSR